jgi:hypothetical protein
MREVTQKRVLTGQPSQDIPRGIVAAIVDDDDLKPFAGQDGSDFGEEIRKIIRLVLRRNDGGEARFVVHQHVEGQAGLAM